MGQTVYVVLYVCVSVAVGIVVGIVFVGVCSVGFLPLVGHSVTIGIDRSIASSDCSYASNLVFIGYECALCAERRQLFYYAAVVRVSYARCSGVFHNGVVCIFSRFEIHWCIALKVRLLHGSCPVVVGYQSAVKLAVAVVVGVVAGAVQVVCLRPIVKILVGSGARTCYEVVVHNVLIVVCCRVSAYNAHRIVVNHVVVVLEIALHLRVTAFVVGPKTVRYGPVAGSVCYCSEALRLYSLAYYAVLVGYVGCVLDVDIVPTSP